MNVKCITGLWDSQLPCCSEAVCDHLRMKSICFAIAHVWKHKTTAHLSSWPTTPIKFNMSHYIVSCCQQPQPRGDRCVTEVSTQHSFFCEVQSSQTRKLFYIFYTFSCINQCKNLNVVAKSCFHKASLKILCSWYNSHFFLKTHSLKMLFSMYEK